MWLACGRHVLYRTKAALLANPACLQCPTCNGVWVYNKCGRAVPVGVAEERLWHLLDKQVGLVWSLQDRIKGWKGGIDAVAYFPLQCWLCIQVDGPTHGRKCMSDRRDQPIKDGDFNAIALGLGMSVLRLDELHSEGSWEAALTDALGQCSMPNPVPGVYLSEG